MTPEDFNEEVIQIVHKDPKKFVESTRIYITEGYFTLRLNIGDSPESFVLMPGVAKALSYFFAQQVKSYEAQFGQIPFDLKIPSPLTATDLNKPEPPEDSPPLPLEEGKEPPSKPSGKKKK